mgnify:CR=1 FL=1
MRDFSAIADFSLQNRPKIHASIVLLSLLMIPGLLQTLTPIDVESYDMDTPEIEAESVIDAEFSSKELAINYAKKKKIDFELIEPRKRKTVKKSYADNFLK